MASGQQCCVLGGLDNHLTYSTTADKDLKLQTTSPPAADGYGHVTQSGQSPPLLDALNINAGGLD